GDYAPLEAVKGVKQYLLEHDFEGLSLVLFGDQAQIKPLFSEADLASGRIILVPTTQVVEMNEHPTRALKEKSDSSIAVGFKYMAAGKIDAFISAGNTGAMMVGAMFSINTVEGVLRPTISSVIPKQKGSTGLLVDVGLNADCKPEH